MTGRTSLLALAASMAIGLASSPAHAQRAPFKIPDPDPEVERRSFIVADGFEVNLFAADPVLAKPIQMNFDPQGRLWVVSSEVYPQILPGQTANDKVLVLEDNDHDGRAEKTRVFADGLLIPTGIEPGDGGAYVANSTELLHFADTDRDGKADRRRVMLSGFGTEDTHHILHTLRWGHDGMLYFNQSVYIHSHVETPHGVRRLGGGGTWQFRPETMELEIFTRGLWNPWGHHFDRWGQSFMTDGAGGEGIQYAFPGVTYAASPGAVRIMPGLNPGSPKYCGFEFLSGRHVPESWRGSLLTADFRGNRVCRFVVSEDGAGFAAREQPELIKTRHVAFRPIDIKMGPDGAIYIADWYNPIIQHGEVDFRDPRRDHTRGRIWRVTAKGRPLVDRPSFSGGESELLELLKLPEDWTRQRAKRVIKERGKAILPALAAWVEELKGDDPDVEHHRLEALWAYQSLDEVEPALLAKLLRANDPRVRAAATRVAGLWQARLSDPTGLLAAQVADEHPRVRLEAVRALARIPGSRSAELAMRALDRPMDRFLDYGLWLTARDLESSWLPEVQAGRFDFGGNARHLVFALQAVAKPPVVKPLVEALRTGRIPAEQVESALTTIATLGEPQDLRLIFDLAANPGPMASSQRLALLEALIRTTRQRNVRPPGDLGPLGKWLDDPDDSLRVAAAQAAGTWKVGSLRTKLAGIARSGATSPPLRKAVIDTLGQLGGTEARDDLRQLAGPDSPAGTQVLAIGALATVDLDDAATRAVAHLVRASGPSEVDPLVTRFAQLRRGPAALQAALKGQTIPADAAKLAIRAAGSAGPPNAGLIEALTAAGRLSASAPLPLPSADEMAKLVADVARLGDPARGEAVFRRKGLDCLKCHAIAGAGGQVGPGLESVGASAQVDYLLDSLLQPSKAIKENYHSVVVATSDGRVVSGIKLRQTDKELVLRDAEDREVSIPLSAIDEQKPGGSLMPTGVVESLPRADLLDLVRFLSELGKIGPYSVSKERLFRRWQVLEPTRADADIISRTGLDSAVEGQSLKNWVPAYSQVSGVLPLDALRPTGTYQGSIGMARAEIDVTTAGPIRLAFHSTDSMRLWIDGNKVEVRPEVTLDLPVGVHTLTLSVDMRHRKEGIRCALEDEPGSPARAQVVLGK